jgi:hypothetical protein
MNKFWLGVIYGVLGQIISFLSLQGSYRIPFFKNNMWVAVLLGIPCTILFILSTHNFIDYFRGQIWPSRIIGFTVGVICFTVMGWIMFRETVSLKTTVMLGLCAIIMTLQVFWKN